MHVTNDYDKTRSEPQLSPVTYKAFPADTYLLVDVPVDKQKKLSDLDSESYRKKLLSLCHIKEGTEQECLEHPFLMTTVTNLFDGSPQDFFYNGISLNRDRADSKYINFIDHRTYAAHPLREVSLYYSLMRFLERQALLGSWLSKKYQYTINPKILWELAPCKDLVAPFLQSGTLYIIQNNNHLPGHSIIMFYFSNSTADPVSYSMGSSTGLSLQETLASALEDLYQCYSSMLYKRINDVDAHHQKIQKYNCHSIRKTIPFLQNLKPYLINSLYDLEYAKEYTYQEVLDELEHISSDIYYYHTYDPETNLHHSKMVSPDFFAHRTLNSSLNIKNCYAKKINITPKNAYLTPIPFLENVIA